MKELLGPPAEDPGKVNPSWQRYLLPLAAVGAASLVRHQLLGFLGPHLPYITFLPAVLLTLLFSGAYAALFAALLSVVYVSYFLHPSLDDFLVIHDATERAVAAFSILGCLTIGFTARLLRNAKRRTAEAEQQAELAHQRSLNEACLRETEARYQEAILGLNAELEQRVRERTSELEAAIREQESFSYSVSHDLRAPLRHINSFSSILMEDHAADLPLDARDYLERIRGATRRMGSLIDHLLELSRLSRTELTREWVDLSRLAADVLSMLQETERHRRVKLCIQEGMLVQGDRELLGQLLENLLGNAWKYSSVREPASIEFGRKSAQGVESFFIKDNGVGFDMAYSSKVFEPFQRLHGSEFEGTGIGLATAERIVKRHGGTIWAEGGIGEGATFYFTLSPAETAGPAPATVPATAPH